MLRRNEARFCGTLCLGALVVLLLPLLPLLTVAALLLLLLHILLAQTCEARPKAMTLPRKIMASCGTEGSGECPPNEPFCVHPNSRGRGKNVAFLPGLAMGRGISVII